MKRKFDNDTPLQPNKRKSIVAHTNHILQYLFYLGINSPLIVNYLPSTQIVSKPPRRLPKINLPNIVSSRIAEFILGDKVSDLRQLDKVEYFIKMRDLINYQSVFEFNLTIDPYSLDYKDVVDFKPFRSSVFDEKFEVINSSFMIFTSCNRSVSKWQRDDKEFYLNRRTILGLEDEFCNTLHFCLDTSEDGEMFEYCLLTAVLIKSPLITKRYIFVERESVIPCRIICVFNFPTEFLQIKLSSYLSHIDYGRVFTKEYESKSKAKKLFTKLTKIVKNNPEITLEHFLDRPRIAQYVQLGATNPMIFIFSRESFNVLSESYGVEFNGQLVNGWKKLTLRFVLDLAMYLVGKYKTGV